MKLKSYILLFLSTAVVSGGILFAGQMMKPTVVEAQSWQLCADTASETLLCSGTVERANERTVSASCNLVVTELFVQEGEQVEAGQQLFTARRVEEASSAATQETYLRLWEEYQATGVIPDSAEEILAASAQARQAASEEPFTVISPISGTVNDLKSLEGDSAAVGDEMMTVSDPQNLQVRLQVGEADIAEIATGQQAEITGSGFPGQTFQGEVLSISDEAVQQASTTGKETVVEVILKVLEPTAEIKPGYTVKASITTEESPDVFLIPYSAVLADDDGQEYIFLVQEGQAVKQPITAEKEYANGLSVKEELPEGAHVILEPEGITEGMYIRETEGQPDA